MLSPVSNGLVFWVFYTKAKVGVAPSSAPTIKVGRRGSGSLIVNGSSMTASLITGLYYYSLASGSTANADEYYAAATTSDTTVDQQDLPALWVVGENNAVGLDSAGKVNLQASQSFDNAGQSTNLPANLKAVLATAITEGGAGRLAAALIKFLDVPTPVFTGASVNQSGDGYAIVNNGTYGNNALLSAIQNVQNNTFVATSIPMTLERPDAGSATVNVSIVFSDETGAAKNLDSGSPAIALVNDAGADLSSRLGAITNPATGKYVVPYTNASGDALEGLHWDVTGTVNGKARRMVAYTQLVDTTAVDFTAADRTKLNRLDTDYTTARAGKLDNLDAAVSSRSTYAGADTAGTTTLLGRITSTRASNLDNLDAAITSRMATFVYTAPDNAGIATLLVRVPDANLSTMAVRFLTMIELDGSVYRYTANALEMAPAGGGGGGSTTGDGDTPVDHNTGGTDALRYMLPGGAVGADNVRVEAFLKSDYDSGLRTIRGTTYTASDGRWVAPLMLNAGLAYYVIAVIPGVTRAVKTEVTP